MTGLQERTPFSRRTFVKMSAAAGAFATVDMAEGRPAKANRYARLKSGKFLSEVKIELEIKDERIFTEGPAVDRDGDVFFTNIPMETILRFLPDTKKLATFRIESNKTNGLYFDPLSQLLACEGAPVALRGPT